MKSAHIYRLLYILAFAVSLLPVSCGGGAGSLDDFSVPVYEPVHALGFEILGSEEYRSTILKTHASWQGAEGASGTMLFISRDGEKAPAGFSGQTVQAGAERIVCMSSTHIAMLDELGAVDRVVGVSGIDFVSNSYVSANRDRIGDVGFDSGADYELIVALDPDLVLLYGVQGASVLESKLRELRIPFAYLGEYLEESPLGKAEWMVAMAEILDCRKKGEAVFAPIPERYNQLRSSVSSLRDKPKVMINSPYGDSWFMASSTSYVAQLIADAGGDYVYRKNNSNTSLPIDIEEAYLLAEESDVWINAGNYANFAEFKSRMPRFVDVPCVRAGEVYDCDRRVNASGGNDYWESGIVHPDIVLRDLIKIFHPEMVEEEFVYYRRLE